MRPLWFLLLILIPASVAAQEYYADILFDVSADGSVAISGTTNHPLLDERSTQEYTSKSRQTWTLNLSVPEKFADYVFVVALPPGATLNYVQSKQLTISTQKDRVIIKSIGSDNHLNIVAQYTIANKKIDYLFEIIGSLFAVGLIMGIMLLAYRQGTKARAKLETEPKRGGLRLRDGLPARQQEIIALLEKSGGSLIQKQIETALGLPKASISRNIEALRRKGLIEKQQSGMSNVVRLK